MITVTKPSEGTWTAYKLAVCPSDPAKCLTLAPCITPDDDPSTGPDVTACPITSSNGLEQGVAYTVKATACELASCTTGITSEQSATIVSFTVPYE